MSTVPIFTRWYLRWLTLRELIDWLLLLVECHVTDVDRLAGLEREPVLEHRRATENDEHHLPRLALDAKAPVRAASRWEFL